MSTGSRFIDQENYAGNPQPGPGYYNVTSTNFRTFSQKVLLIEVNRQITEETMSHLVVGGMFQVIEEVIGRSWIILR
jgi:hypothetical protein